MGLAPPPIRKEVNFRSPAFALFNSPPARQDRPITYLRPPRADA
jgi:hypothetical protein